MKKLFSTLFILVLGLQVSAAHVYPLSNMPSREISGKTECRGGKDVIIMDSKMSTYDSIFNARNAATSLAGAGAILAVLADPYYIQVDGKNYVMLKDKKSKDWSSKDFLGIEDTKKTLFNGLKSIESDSDKTKITSNELKKANIRFARVMPNGTVLANDRTQDFSLDKIDYIDMTSLQKLANSKVKGIAGHFRVFLKTNDGTKRMVMGYATLDHSEKLQTVFE